VSAPVACAIIGAGPAGLAAAEIVAGAGHAVHVFDSMPSPARKFLRAGIGGLNLTHCEPFDAFLARYGAAQDFLAPLLDRFGPQAVQDWCKGLGIDTFTGSSGRVFPVGMKAAPLLRAWLRRLDGMGVVLHPRHRWQGWTPKGELTFATPEGDIRTRAETTILALGGASWPRLGSDGGWTGVLQDQGIACTPLKPANCGFDVEWSPFFRDRFAGFPVKAAGLSFGGTTLKGEFVVTRSGIEGSAVYALSAPLRDAIEADGTAILRLDMKPDWSYEKLASALAAPRGSRSLSAHLERSARLSGIALSLLKECVPGCGQDAGALAAALKSLPLKLVRPRPVAEAISSAGGVRLDQVNQDLMVKSRPGLFIAGEMLDWEAPTGGYLLTACLAMGRTAGMGAARLLAQ
jgi:uncharacterized flavoprotein (TIGR03862 family)